MKNWDSVELTRGSKGWLPIDIDVRANRQRVEWLYFGDSPLTEPLFSQSVARLKAMTPSPPSWITSVNALSAITPEVPPRGFIFHMSRCGSTLVSNSMRAIAGTAVVAEPEVFGPLLMTRAREDHQANTCVWKDSLLRGAVAAFGQRRVGDETGLVVKFSSWQIRWLGTFRQLWPDVPFVVMVRDPLEVVVSCLRKPPGWMKFKNNSEVAGILFNWNREQLLDMSDECFCARVIAEYIKSATGHVGPLCKVFNYSDLTVASLLDLASFFGINARKADEARIATHFMSYSKDADGKKTFTDDRKEKQLAASDLIRCEVKKWADKCFRELL
jgi:hypothetical protein